MRILITGSQGFVGHHFYRYLKLLGHQVRGIDIAHNGYCQNWYDIDLRFKHIMPEPTKWDLIIHLASDVGGINHLQNNGFSIMDNNIRIDLNVIEYARLNAKKLVYFSSSCVYDDNEYGKEKLFTEELIKASGIDYLIVRPQNIYGIEDIKKGAREQVIMALFRKALTEKEVNLMGTGNEKRSFVHIEDLFVKVMHNLEGSKIIDVGGEWISIKSLAKRILKIINLNKRIKTSNNKEAKKKYIEFKQTNIDLNDGLREVYRWLLSQ